MHPIEPKIVNTGPVKENIIYEDGVDLLKLPFPIWTPGKDDAPYDTAGHVVTKDPETGMRNVGNYRKQVKGKNKMGILILPFQHIGIMYRKYEEMNKPMPIALVIGNIPAVSMAAVAKVPYGLDEFAVAGALNRAPIELVKCETCEFTYHII